MKLPELDRLSGVLRRSRAALRLLLPARRPRIRTPPPGGFQPYSYTLPDRYPWLFEFARRQLAGRANPNILSFGCCTGDEVFALRRYFPAAQIKGIDIEPGNIATCRELARKQGADGIVFDTAATTEHEASGSYDAIFCLAVLCHGDLTTFGAQRCDPFLRFEEFERLVTDFSRCLKPEGLLLLHTTNFRFRDTAAYGGFDPVLEADPGQMAPDALFDRHNRLMPGAQYREVAFRKRAG